MVNVTLSAVSAGFDYLHFGEPFLLDNPQVERHKVPNKQEQRVYVPPEGHTQTVHLNFNSSIFLTTVSMAEKVNFLDRRVSLRVRT